MFTRAVFALCITFLPASLTGEKSEILLEELTTAHAKVGSYFAHYQGESADGKSINAVFAFHEAGQMAALEAEFIVDGSVVAAPLQIVTPAYGLIYGGEDPQHFHDVDVIIRKLDEVAEILCGSHRDKLDTWSPALFLTDQTAKAQLSLSGQRKLPWKDADWKEITAAQKENDIVTFQTPEGANYAIDAKTGILKEQNFPNEQGDRTLVLKELLVNLSEEEIRAFIETLVPKQLEKTSFRESPLFNQLEAQTVNRFISLVDDKTLSLNEAEKRVSAVNQILMGYLSLTQPNAARVIAPLSEWDAAIESLGEVKSRESELRSKMEPKLDALEVFNYQTIENETTDGAMAAFYWTRNLDSAFLNLAVKQALAQYDSKTDNSEANDSDAE